MEVSYRRDMNHSFLVVRPENQVDTKAYPVRMVLGNGIPGLLPCRLQKADGDILLYYDITNRQCLAETYRTLNYEELKEIYQSFLSTFEQMEMYLLNPDQLFLEPEYVYVDKKEKSVSLCYLPGFEKPVQEQLCRFTEYLLPRMEHQDSRGVMLGYGMYRLMAGAEFQVEAVREILHKSENVGKETEKFQGDSLPGKETGEEWDIRNNEESGDAREDEGKISNKEWFKDAVLILGGLLFFGGFAGLKQMGYFAWLTLPAILAVFFLVISCMGMILQHRKKREAGNKCGKREIQEAVEAEETVWEQEEPEFLRGDIHSDTEGEETVILYRNPEYNCPVLVCEEAGQAPPILLNREMIIVGKVDGVSDALLDRASVSRVHAKIQKKGDEYWIGDLNSKNGTFVNGKKLEKDQEHLLQPEDLVIFADISYRFWKNC